MECVCLYVTLCVVVLTPQLSSLLALPLPLSACSNEQFNWITQALGLRPVHIMTYGKINFIYTVLSKRKLNWFVEEKLVDGWNDARFPTIQGCIRRGMNVDSLKKFIISQGR